MKKNLVFIYGIHAVLAALKNSLRTPQKLWLSKKNINTFQQVLGETPHEICEEKTLDSIMGKEVVHQGVILQTTALAEVSLTSFLKNLKKEACIIILDQVTDPQNLGAILRSCAAFSIDALIVPDHHSPNFEGTIAKVASGALEIVPIIRVTNLVRALETLKENNFWCYGFAEEGREILGQHKFSGSTALVFGAEGEGLRRLTKQTCDVLIKIPTTLQFSTLNVAQTASIAVFECRRQQPLS